MAFPFLQLEQLTVQRNGRMLLDHIDLVIQSDEQWAVTGSSGSGKTMLAHTLAGQQHYSGRIIFNEKTGHRPEIVVVEQQHRFKNLSNTSDFYYQQRYNATDANNTLTVAEVLHLNDSPSATLASGITTSELPRLVHIAHILQEPLIQLSNGENKRLQIAKAILSEPELLILDNPFVGLDTEGRTMLTQVINTLSHAGVKIILITPATEIPDCITHVAILENGKLISANPKKKFNPHAAAFTTGFRINRPLLKALQQPAESNFEYAVKMANVYVQYGERTILKNINWEVKKGAHWSISGPNGAGKSTLLSLITGDNTKAYANEIYLFDKRRGSGESIWDIKRKIGYVSPEMHVYFDYTATCFETIASGLFDSIGLFKTLTAAQRSQVNQWLTLFKLEPLQNKLLSLLSAGEQRLVLLARALVKNPPLLILDEPCQGLDREHVHQFRQIINDICGLFDTTLLYVSHYKEEIPECVTHFMRIENGEASFT
ncbi:ATP-binding cassette domain-containing protein [Agriterribacter sp.]|uniref:ATP-binding cassette domain-containing protein n=1 Tax=Agriterribacter sp. TaxID=2821509 RepID=UPI002B7EB1F0|nr:ATP-binding cassette domain-containing protein [Agriterribacter sp.]HTN05095.1 ATP-binding cassette domain-containing protein [Agriterribacter sp.]